MEFLKKILNKINPGIKKGIGIFVSQESTLEVIEYDYDLDEVNAYSCVEFEYDQVLREVNVENFEITLQSILRKFEITQQMPVVLTLPNIFINKKILPIELENEEVQTALVSETEKKYIFKKTEPIVSWNIVSVDKDNQINNIIYSALQKQIVEKLTTVFKRQGIKLTALETSYPAFVRGISVSGLADECIDKNLNWGLIIVKNTSNAAIILKGSQIIDINEVPLALNSQDLNDLYPSIASNLIEKLDGMELQTLVIANYSNIVDINNLAAYLDLSCPIVKIQNNSCKGEPIFSYGNGSDVKFINPEVIGASCWKSAPVRFGFNFLSISNQEDAPGILSSLGVTGNPLHLILLGLITLSFLLITLISLLMIPINIALDEKYRVLHVKCSEYQQKFDKPQTKTFNLFDVVNDDFKSNENLVASFGSISNVIPEKVWVSSIEIDEKLNASIKGRAYSVEDIVNYYENLLSASKFNNFKIRSIKVVGENAIADINTPDVSVNAIGNNPVPVSDNPPLGMDPASNPNGSPVLPPPPSSSEIASNPIMPIAGPKYYEFDFGNPVTEAVSANSNEAANKQKAIIPGFSNITQNLKLGNQQN